MEFKRSAWKYYFYFMLLLAIYGFFKSGPFDILEYIKELIFLPALLALHGYVFSRDYFERESWKVFFVISLLLVLFIISLEIYTQKELLAEISYSSLFLLYGLSFLLNAPMYYALYRYSFLSEELEPKV